MSIEFTLKLLAECLSPNDLERSGLKRFIHESIHCMEINWNAIAGPAVFKNTGIHEKPFYLSVILRLSDRNYVRNSSYHAKCHDNTTIFFYPWKPFSEKREHEYLIEPPSQFFFFLQMSD